MAFDPRNFTVHEFSARLKISYQAAYLLLIDMCDSNLVMPTDAFCGRRNHYRLTPFRNQSRRNSLGVSDPDLIRSTSASASCARNPERSDV